MGKTEICKRVLKKVTPSKGEIGAEKKLTEEIVAKIKGLEGSHVDVMAVGSTARNTHLRGDRDIDIFVLFPTGVKRERFVEEGLKIGKRIFRGHKWEKAYSEHPYIRGKIGEFDVEVVPSYKIGEGHLLESSVDRSPFHMAYLMGKLTAKDRKEVRLLRQFLKGIGCYGADLKVSSVPGYVVELLILKYGSFDACIKAVSKWKDRQVIELSGERDKAEKELLKRFDSPLVVIDPVDNNRNVAAALSLNQYSRLIAASRAFLKKPSMNFFFPGNVKPWPLKKVKEMLGKKELVGVKIAYPKKALSDILWGQARRLRKKLVSQMGAMGFVVVRSEDWMDEESAMAMVFELESLELQRSEKRAGPRVADVRHSEKFLASHKRLISGPRIEDGRWVIEIPRKYVNANKFLRDYLKKARKDAKSDLKKGMNKKTEVMDEKKLVEFYKKNRGFAKFLTRYLRGREEFV